MRLLAPLLAWDMCSLIRCAAPGLVLGCPSFISNWSRVNAWPCTACRRCDRAAATARMTASMHSTGEGAPGATHSGECPTCSHRPRASSRRGTTPPADACLVLHFNRLAPGFALAALISAQVHHLAVAHATIGKPPVLHHAPLVCPLPSFSRRLQRINKKILCPHKDLSLHHKRFDD